MTPPPDVRLIKIESASFGAGFRSQGVRGQLDPFVSVDRFQMSQPTFPPHPHAGFNVLTYMLPHSPGSFVNRASFDKLSMIHPGHLHWTVAGSGMVHEEVPQERGTVCDGLQIFIHLSADRRSMQPTSLHASPDEIPVLSGAGCTVRVVLGETELNGQRAASPLRPPTEVSLLDIDLPAKSELMLPVPAGHRCFVLVISGRAEIGGTLADHTHAALVEPRANASRVSLVAGEQTQVIVFMGEPLNERTVARGPFIMGSEPELERAMADYRAGRMGQLAPYYPA